ncbi:hypothetical protein [Flavobacterium sp.]|uniref:hypothetical protein n=1 Tax=Flavobacterium sp. TaxID=239 RepID=UPI003526E02A
MYDEKWKNYSSTKKGEILTYLIDVHKDTIKNNYLELDRSAGKKRKKEKTKADNDYIDELYKNILG